MQFGLFAVFATLLVVGAVSFGALLEARDSQRWIGHSNEIRVQLAKLGWAIDKSQAAARAFALGGDDAFLRDALASRSLANEQRVVLLALTADNQDQQRRLGALAGLKPPISLEAAKKIGNGSLAAALEAYRRVPQEMEQAELQLLTEREAQMVRYFRLAELSMGLGSIFGLAFVFVAGGMARRDSTVDRKIKAEDAERMRVLVDGVQDYAIFMLDPQGKVLSWNDGARRTKGYQSAEIIGQNFSRFYPQSDIDAGLPEEELRMAAANGRSEVERWRVRKDGSRFLASMVFTAARDSAGTLIGFSEISRDISERKGTDAKYRGLLEAAPDAMVVVDQAGKIVLLNVQAEKQFGYRRDELLGQKVTEIIPTGFAERLIADGTRSAADALAQQIGTGIELSGRRKDGSDFPIEIMLSPLENKEGILVTAAIRDISVRRDAEQHLAQMEGRYRGLLEAAPDAMVVVDQAGKIVLLNVQAEKRFGYSRDELLAQEVTAIIPEGFAERLIADGTRTAAEALAQQIGTGIELSGRRKDGSDFPIEIMLSPLDSKEGILVTAAIRDISVRKEAELHLAQVEGKYRGLLEAAPDGMVVVDQGGKMVLLNLQAEKLFGYHRHELVGQQVTDIIPVGFAERLIADGTRTAAEALAQQIGTGIELSGRCKNGTYFPIELMLSPLESPDGVLVTAAIRDISVRKKAEAHLAEMEGRYRGLLEAAPEAIVISDPNGRILLVNAQMEKVFGYLREELIGEAVEILVPERFRAKHPDNRAGYHTHPRARSMGENLDLQGLRKDGSEFPVEITLSPLESPEGLLVTAVVRDITERKKFQEDQLQTLGELKRSNDELEHFAYVASHDLQEPLRMVASYTQLLAKRYKGTLDANADDFIGYAVAGCNRMQRLINDLLAYSRAGANGKTPRKISSELALREALTNLETSIAESGALVTHDALPVVTMDDTQLTQVFQNLIGNAVKYRSAAAPRVHVSANTNDSNECVFSVQDNGLGIDSQYFEKIFILFQRLHGRDEFEGTGIGLAVCKKMLERLGGRIWLDSQPDKGSTFHFAVPEGIAK